MRIRLPSIAAAILATIIIVPACVDPVTYHGITIDKPYAWTVSETNTGSETDLAGRCR